MKERHRESEREGQRQTFSKHGGLDKSRGADGLGDSLCFFERLGSLDFDGDKLGGTFSVTNKLLRER